MHVQSHEFDTQQENTLLMHARINERGNLEVRWRGRVDSMLDQYLKLNLTHLPLSDFSPYTLVYTGYPLTGGSISIASENTIASGKLKGMSELTLWQAEVGEKDKSRDPEYKISLKTALYLITDSKNCAVLKLPLKGDIQSPRFSYKRLIVKTVFNVLGQVALSPVAAIAAHSAKTSGLQDFIEVDARSAELKAAQYASLDQLALLWQENKQFRFALTQRLNLSEGMNDFMTTSLQFDYYLQRHPDTQPSDLMFMDKSDIYRIDVKSKDVKAFVNARLQEKGIAPGKKYMDNVDALYRQATLKRLADIMERRDEVVRDYLTRSLHLPQTAVTVASDSLSALASYSGKNGYQISIVVEDESAAGDAAQ